MLGPPGPLAVGSGNGTTDPPRLARLLAPERDARHKPFPPHGVRFPPPGFSPAPIRHGRGNHSKRDDELLTARLRTSPAWARKGAVALPQGSFFTSCPATALWGQKLRLPVFPSRIEYNLL